MNKRKNLTKTSLCLATLLLAWFATAGFSAEPMKGGPHMRHLMGITTEAQADALKPGDTMAMVCSKCKSLTLHNVTTEKGHIKSMAVGEKHLCPGCNSTIEVVGSGKSKHDELKHVCAKCGDDSAFCCATKAGSKPTPGMEKK